jgi:hypothetical protein
MEIRKRLPDSGVVDCDRNDVGAAFRPIHASSVAFCPMEESPARSAAA